jgi:hypothetical protein
VDCPKRHKNCHATCKEFKDWREAKDKDNILKRNNKDIYKSYIMPKKIKMEKRKREKNRT